MVFTKRNIEYNFEIKIGNEYYREGLFIKIPRSDHR